ncbi:helix-turn-helix domain-containing protein [Haloactinospora alba]|uniref:helix-turn-helix domain-containing protein n=1 Tax=Haloactinospora alba TaxID=405555 RepID=UPI00114DE833|nr:helix-turn-helix transcriptional regulator [Haloactinospora alba]
MPGSPIARRRRLSSELRVLREDTGRTAQEVTDALGWSRGKLTHIEQNQWKRPNVRDVEDLLDEYKITDETKREELLTLASQARQRGWWSSFTDALGTGMFVGLEAEARSIRTFEALAIPGLLQTEDYARAVIRGGGFVDEEEISRRVQARMLRKQVLEAKNAPLFWAIIDESALRKVTPELKGQLQHLLDVQRSSVGIQVLPDSIGPHAAMTGSFVILDFPEPDTPVVYLDTGSDELYLEKPAHLERYETLWRYSQAAALSVDESRRFIEELLET